MTPPAGQPAAAEQVADTDHAFSALMQQAHVAIARGDASARLIQTNHRWLEVFGYPGSTMLGLTVSDITHPDSAGATAEMFTRLRAGESHFSYEKKYWRKDRTTFWASTTVSVLRDPAGAITGFIAMVVDLTAQRRSHRLVECQNEALQLVISGAPLPEIFNRLIAAVQEEAEGDAVASILLFEEATGRLRHGAAPGLPDDYNRAVDGIGVARNLGTCAAAAARNEIVFTPDLATDPGWQTLKNLPLALGLRAAWSKPIVSASGQVLGTFGTYFRNCRRPTEAEMAAVGMLAQTAALAIERARAAEQLAAVTRETGRQQRLYDTVASNTPDLIYVFNLRHQFTYANKALLAMWGKTWDESIGKTCLELGYEPWHAAMHDREIDEVAATKRPIRGEAAFNGTNGRRFYDYIFVPVIGANGEVEAIAGTTRDITDQRKAASDTRLIGDLMQQLTLLEAEGEIVRQTIAAVGRHLGAHRCHFVECLESQNLIRIADDWVRDDTPRALGTMSLYDFGGAEWWRKFSAGDFAVEDTQNHPLIDAAAAARYAANRVHSYAAQPVRRTGEWTVVLTVTETSPRRWTPEEMRLLDNVAARVWPLVERVRSEAALRAARDEALAASRAKDDFLAALSHELRTPLNPVLLLASEAAGNPKLPAEVREDFDTIVRNVSLEARLIDDLLDLTRIAHNKLTLKPRVQELHPLLHQALGNLQPEIGGKRIDLELRLMAGAPRIHGDEVRLQQVFWNLLRNAVKFTPAGGRIGVSTRVDPARPDRIAIEISDTGIGLTAPELARVFTPFAQGEHSDGGKAQYGGLGLGLVISQKIAELHQGAVTVQSAGRDQGARFTVELPLATSPEPAAVARPSTGSRSPLGPGSRLRRVLLVEDHEPSRVALARLLANRKIEVVQAGSASEALNKALHDTFDLVISDIGLPDSSGYELMTALQARHGCRGIALSGYGTEKDIARSRDAGFLSHLTKPVQAGALDEVLETAARGAAE